MGFRKWHKRDRNAALRGMAALTLEERGAYNTILDPPPEGSRTTASLQR